LQDPITRQTAVGLERLDYDKAIAGFCMQFYVPFYKDFLQKENTKDLVYQMFSSVTGVKDL